MKNRLEEVIQQKVSLRFANITRFLNGILFGKNQFIKIKFY